MNTNQKSKFMKTQILILLLLVGISLDLLSQDLTQTIRGVVQEETTEVTLPGATINTQMGQQLNWYRARI